MATVAIGQDTGFDRSTRITLWLLLVVYVFNFLDRQIVNILAEPIAKDLKLSDTQIGLMTGLAFAVFYTVLGLPIARYADRPTTYRGRLIAVALTIWSGMTALCGFAQNYAQLLLARIGVGVGEAGCTPAAHSLIAGRVPPERRASALAFYAMGIPIGSLLGMAIGGYLADSIGWRKAFIFVGLPGVLLALIVALVLRDDRSVSTATRSAPRLSTWEALRAIFTSRAYILLLLAGSGASFLSYGKGTWTTIFFQRSHGMSTADVGWWFGVFGGLAGVLGTWLGGWCADRFGREDRRRIMATPAIGMVIAAPIAFSAYFMTDWRLSLLLLMVPTVFNSLYYGPCYSSAQGLVPLQARAMSSAVLLFCQNLVGLGLGPLFFGWLSDLLKPEYGTDSVRYVLFGAAWLGLVPAFFFWRCGLRLNDELDRHAQRLDEVFS